MIIDVSTTRLIDWLEGPTGLGARGWRHSALSLSLLPRIQGSHLGDNGPALMARFRDFVLIVGLTSADHAAAAEENPINPANTYSFVGCMVFDRNNDGLRCCVAVTKVVVDINSSWFMLK